MKDEVEITPYADGPFLVRGPVKLLDSRGEEIELRRRTIAICRCGRSRIHPLCDGTHKTIGFKAAGRGDVAQNPGGNGGPPGGEASSNGAGRVDGAGNHLARIRDAAAAKAAENGEPG